MDRLVVPSKSAHCYPQEGNPGHTVIGKNGKEKNTTIREARELNLVPSVTSILGILAKPHLTAWLQEQAILSALTLPRQEGETEDVFAKRVVEDMSAQSRNAMDLGSTIHRYIADPFVSLDPDIASRGLTLTEPLLPSRTKMRGAFEVPFSADTFGGCIDFVGFFEGEKIIIDFKTQNAKNGKIVYWDDWLYQLCGYRLSQKENFKIANIVISTTSPQVDIKVWSEEEVAKGERIFLSCLDIFRAKNKLL